MVPRARRPQPMRAPRHLLRDLCRLSLGLALIAVVSLLLVMHWLGVVEVHAWQAQAKPYFLLWRIALVLVAAVFWPELVAWAGQRYQLPTAAHAQLLAWRWRLPAVLLVFDLLVIQNHLGRLLGL